MKISPSPTLAIDARVKKMQSEGILVINLGLGEPDFTTPPIIKKAAIKAIKDGYTHYTQTAGIPALRKAICQKLLKENKIGYEPEQIVVGVGSKQLLYHAFQVLCEKGDEVIIPVPTWNTYVEQVKLAGAKPILIRLEPPFKLTAAVIKPYVNRKTKILLLNSPSNPTGAIIEPHELRKIAELAIRHNFFVISDEIYEKIIYGKKHVSIASFSNKIKERTVTINGFSKAFAMTGWRIGYAAGPKKIIDMISALQSQTTSNTASISQYAALAAMTNKIPEVETMRKEFKARRDLVTGLLSTVKSLTFTVPEGAFYVYVSLNQTKSEDWCNKLLTQRHVAVVPGEAFFYPGYFRLSFATSRSNLKKGIEAIRQFSQKYE